jgi:hypothetical protein
MSTKYVEHEQYLLNIKTLPEKKITQNKRIVFIDQITAAPPFDQLDFLYRVSSDRYLTDYYHSFLVSPAQQLEPKLVNYLKALGNFNLETKTPSILHDKLQVKITQFYADYRNHALPKATIGIHFTLTRSVDDKNTVLFDKTLCANISLKEKNTNSLLEAWGLGLRNILSQVVNELNIATAKKTPPAEPKQDLNNKK